MGGGVHFHRPHSGAPLPRQLPGDVNGFVDRSAYLDQLDRTLAERRRNPVTLVVGTAGVGKTSLIVHWGHTRREHFPDGQLYANLRGHDAADPVTPLRVLEGFVSALGVPREAIPWDVDECAALYRSLLADRRTLVVLDNAATAAQVRPLLPGAAGCPVLVTGRGMLAGLVSRDGADRITLRLLSEPDAVTLLREAGLASRDDPPENLAELARSCACLPLALRVAAERAIARPWTPLREMIAELRGTSGLLSDGDTDAIQAVFTWSYRSLPPDAARLFRALSLHPGPDFGLPAAAALAGAGPGAVRDPLDVLTGAHLLEPGPAGRFHFHELLRSYAMDRSRRQDEQGERTRAVRRMLTWYLYTADAAQTWINPQERSVPLPRAEREVEPLAFDSYDSAVRWYERERANLVAATRAAADSGLPEHAWKLSVVLRNIYMRFNPFEDWVTTSRIGLEAARTAGDRRGEADLLESLGMAYTQSHELAKGAESHGAALSIRRETGDSEGEALSLNDLGLVHLRSRRLDEARALFERGTEICRELNDPHWEAVLAANLGEARAELGELDAAEAMVEHALALFRDRAEQGGEGNALRLLSMIRRARSDAPGALDAANRAVAIARTSRNPAWEGYWLLELARAQRLAGDAPGSLSNCERAMELQHGLGDRVREALARDVAGEACRDLSRLETSETYHRAAAASLRRYADSRWPLSLALDNLATTLTSQRRTPEAHATWAEALRHLASFTDPKAQALRTRMEHSLSAP
ncbi:tetratricopeptide repeat protein [Actinomadura sp. NEAU-AAG5]|uniref:Tetratricopeptide repeat protein n=1 Tax=Actinomadura litoris TaxID=2678616 RepID=A0A7K1KY53_9ACTN|nr:tetratricopeptide repeat protein [Actinomadura litoris]